MKAVYGILMLITLAGIICAAGCITTETKGEVPNKFVSISEENNGDLIPVDMRTPITIKLLENPTTGYSWNVTGTEGLAITDDTFEPPKAPIPGAGGVHVWTLKPEVTGMVTFTAKYVRSWEEAQANDMTYSITFYVTPEGASVVNVNSANDGTTITGPKNGVAIVTLDENPTTGYQWTAKVSGNAEIAADSFVPPYSEAPLVGAGGIHKWIVTFTGEPSGTFEAGYARPWEENVADEKSFTVTFAQA
ncbi:MAG: protease inhibitor I42 family protein [Methanomicrobiales archaeon]|nr:protease inhibitor I42 family protein [Methanomicrobiales archaeon]